MSTRVLRLAGYWGYECSPCIDGDDAVYEVLSACHPIGWGNLPTPDEDIIAMDEAGVVENALLWQMRDIINDGEYFCAADGEEQFSLWWPNSVLEGLFERFGERKWFVYELDCGQVMKLTSQTLIMWDGGIKEVKRWTIKEWLEKE